MAKQILLSILVDKLGQYVEGLSADNLKASVWAGELQFANLSVKASALSSLDLPLSITNASLGTLSVSIPWKNLGGDPIRIFFDGVSVQLGPSDDSKFTAEDLQRHTAELKKRILGKAQEIAFAFVSSELIKKEKLKGDAGTSKPKRSWFGISSSTYAQRLIAKVLANIEVKVRNIHIRYEDGTTLPNTLLATGVTLDELLVITTDERSAEGEGDSGGARRRRTNNASTANSGRASSNVTTDETIDLNANTADEPLTMFKVVTLRNLAVYWCPNATPLSAMAASDREGWQRAMKDMLYTDINPCDGLDYIISPPNLVKVNVVHREDVVGSIVAQTANKQGSSGGTAVGGGGIVSSSSAGDDSKQPALAEVTVNLEQLSVDINKVQLMQAIALMDSFAVLQRQRHLFLFRPTERPTKNPRAWWVYAFMLLSGRDDIVYHKREVIDRCIEVRGRYKELIAKTLKRPTAPVSALLLGDQFQPPLGPGSQWLNKLPESPPISKKELVELSQLEEQLPLQALISYRQQAVIEALLVAYNAAMTKPTKKGKIFKRFPWLNPFAQKPPEPDPEPVPLPPPPPPAQQVLPEPEPVPAPAPAPVPIAAKKKKKRGFFACFSCCGGNDTLPQEPEPQRPQEVKPTPAPLPPPVAAPVVVPKKEEDDVSFNSLKDKFLRTLEGEADAAEASAGGMMLLRLHLEGSLRVTVADHAQPLLGVEVSFGTNLDVKSLTAMSAFIYVSEFSISDLVTPHAQRPMILSFAAAAAGRAAAAAESDFDFEDENAARSSLALTSSSASPGAKASVPSDVVSSSLLQGNRAAIFFERGSSGAGQAVLRVGAQPLEIALNYLCFQRLADMLVIPIAKITQIIPTILANDYIAKTARAENNDIITARRATKVATEAASVLIGDRMDIIVDAYGPKVVISDDFTGNHDRGFLVVDLGRVKVEGSVSSSTGLDMTIAAVGLSAGLPLRSKDIYKYMERGEFFIPPIDATVKVVATVPNDDDALIASDAIITVEVKNGMQMMLDSAKMIRIVDKFNSGMAFGGAISDALAELPVKDQEAQNRMVEAAAKFTSGFAQALNDTFLSDALTEASTDEDDEEAGAASVLRAIEADIIAAAKKRRALSQKKRLADVRVALPGLSVELQYPYGRLQGLQAMVLEFSRINLGVIKRLFDTRVSVRVGSMTVEDTLRPRSQKYLLQSVSTDDGGNSDFVRLVVTQIFDRHSELAKNVYSDALAAVKVEGEMAVSNKKRHAKTKSDAGMTYPIGGIDEELEITVTAIQLSIDANAVKHLHAVTSLVIERIFAPDSAPASAVFASSLCSSRSNAVNDYARGSFRGSAIASLGISQFRSKNMKTILLENFPKNKLLKDKDRDNVFWAQDSLDKNGRAILVLRIAVDRVSIDIFEALSGEDESPDSGILDSVCKVEVFGVGLLAATLHKKMAQMHLGVRDMAVLDTRIVSEDWEYRTIMSTRNRASTLQEDAVADRFQWNRNFLDVKFTERTIDNIVIDVVAKHVLATVALDATLDISRVGMAILYDMLTIIKSTEAAKAQGAEAALQTPNRRWLEEQTQSRRRFALEDIDEDDADDGNDNGASTNGRRGNKVDKNATGNSDKDNSLASSPHGIHLQLSVPRVQLALLEDPSLSGSQAFLLACDLEVQVGDDHWGGELQESQQSAHCSVQDITMFAVSDVGAWLDAVEREDREEAMDSHKYGLAAPVKRHIALPFSVDMHLTRRVEKGIVLSANVTMNVGDVNAAVSLAHIALIRSILLRSTLTGLVPPRSSDVFQCIFGERKGDQGTQVDIYVVAVNIGTVTINAINDIEAPSADTNASRSSDRIKLNNNDDSRIVRLQLLSLAFNGDGAIMPRLYVSSAAFKVAIDVLNLEGFGQASLCADYLNPSLAMWEPIIEEWHPSLMVTKEPHGIALSVNAESGLNVSVSGRLIDSLFAAYAQWLRRQSEMKSSYAANVGANDDDADDDEDDGRFETKTPGFRRKLTVSQLYGPKTPVRTDRRRTQSLLLSPSSQLGISTDFPNITLHNRLLCDLHYRIVDATSIVAPQSDTADGVLGPGCSIVSLAFDVNARKKCLMFKIGSMDWSAPYVIPRDKEKVVQVDWVDTKEPVAPTTTNWFNNKSSVNLTPQFSVCAFSTNDVDNNQSSGYKHHYEVTVFSDCALIDRSGLLLHIRADRKKKSVERRCHFEPDYSDDNIGLRREASEAAIGRDFCQRLADRLANGSSKNASLQVMENFVAYSRREYAVKRNAQRGDTVYTDRDILWSYLPEALLNQQFVATSCDDYAARSWQLLRFTVNKPSLVFVLTDASVSRPPPDWLLQDDYRRVVMPCIAKRFVGDKLVEYHYNAWGKYVDPAVNYQAGRHRSMSTITKDWQSQSVGQDVAGVEIALGGAESAGENALMYSVFVVDIATLNIPQDDVMEVVGQVLTELGTVQSTLLTQARDLWADGGQGLCMFHSDNNKFAVGVQRGKAWSADLPLQVATSKFAFEVADINEDAEIDEEEVMKARVYQLAYTARPLPGLFNRTKLVVVMPQFAILNCMEEPLEVRQHGSDEKLFIEPFNCRPWHKSDGRCGTKVQLRCASSSWSFGSIDINEVGSSVLLLPSKDWFEGSANQNAVVAQVEVKLASAKENCSVVMVVWRADRDRGSSLSVRNETDIPFTILQDGTFPGHTMQKQVANDAFPTPELQEAAKSEASKYMVCVGPESWSPIGWADPETGDQLIVTAGTPPHGASPIRMSIGLLKLNEIYEFEIEDDDLALTAEEAAEAASRDMEKKIGGASDSKAVTGAEAKGAGDSLSAAQESVEEGDDGAAAEDPHTGDDDDVSDTDSSLEKFRIDEDHPEPAIDSDTDSDSVAELRIGGKKRHEKITHAVGDDDSDTDSLVRLKFDKDASDTESLKNFRVEDKHSDTSSLKDFRVDEDSDSDSLLNFRVSVKKTTKVFVAVQALGSGKVVRIVRKIDDFGVAMTLNGADVENKEEDSLTNTQKAAIIGGVAVGIALFGILAPVAIIGGAGIYAYSRHAKATADKEAAEKINIERVHSRAKAASEAVSTNAGVNSTLSLVTSEKGTSTSTKSDPQMGMNMFSIAFSFEVPSVAISLTVEKPVRREFLNLHIQMISGCLRATTLARSLELEVGDMQLDSYSETAMHPVILYARKRYKKNDMQVQDVTDGDDQATEAADETKGAGPKNADDAETDLSEPMLKVTIVEEYTTTGTPHYKYVAIRLLELVVAIDTATVQMLLTDMGADFSFVSREQQLALRVPDRWADEFSAEALSPERRIQLVDIYKSQISAQAPKVFIENLVVHPIKVTLSFNKTILPRRQDETALAIAVSALSYVPVFANLDNVTLRLNSFIVENAMESIEALLNRIGAGVVRDLEVQVARLAGSLTAIGRPVGLARNIGGGVRAFFYEPYEGLMHGPGAFVYGLGKGAGSLVGNVLSGALTSAFAVVNTASQGLAQGISYFGDEQFVQNRVEKRRRAQEAAREGILSGIQEGGISLVSGVAYGFSGLVTKPLAGAKDGGAFGFVKGVGYGVVGAPVNVVLGVTDGLNSVAQTLLVQTSNVSLRAHIRPARAFDCILTHEDIEEAAAAKAAAASVIKNKESSSLKVTVGSTPTTAAGTSQLFFTVDYDEKGRSGKDDLEDLAADIIGNSTGNNADEVSGKDIDDNTDDTSDAQSGSVTRASTVKKSSSKSSYALPLLRGKLLLTPLSIPAAHAQAFILNRAKRKNESDAFVGFQSLIPPVEKSVSLSNSSKVFEKLKRDKDASVSEATLPAVFLSLRYVFWRRTVIEVVKNSKGVEKQVEKQKVDIIPWQSVSHTEPCDPVSLGLYHLLNASSWVKVARASSEGRAVRRMSGTEDFGVVIVLTSGEKVRVDCPTRKVALQLLDLFARNRHRAQSPKLVVSGGGLTNSSTIDALPRDKKSSSSTGPAVPRTADNESSSSSSKSGSAKRTASGRRPSLVEETLLANSMDSLDEKPTVDRPRGDSLARDRVGSIDEHVGKAAPALLASVSAIAPKYAGATRGFLKEQLSVGAKEEIRELMRADNFSFGENNYEHAADLKISKAQSAGEIESEGIVWLDTPEEVVAKVEGALGSLRTFAHEHTRKMLDDDGVVNLELESSLTSREGHQDKDPAAVWNKLDRILVSFIWEWQEVHRGMRASKLACCLLVNGSSQPVKLDRLKLLKGRSMVTVGVFSYDEKNQVVESEGGAVLIIFWGDYWIPNDSGHAKAVIETSRFHVTLSTKKDKSNIGSIMPREFDVPSAHASELQRISSEPSSLSMRFLESSSANDGMWSKFVIFMDNNYE